MVATYATLPVAPSAAMGQSRPGPGRRRFQIGRRHPRFCCWTRPRSGRSSACPWSGTGSRLWRTGWRPTRPDRRHRPVAPRLPPPARSRMTGRRHLGQSRNRPGQVDRRRTPPDRGHWPTGHSRRTTSAPVTAWPAPVDSCSTAVSACCRPATSLSRAGTMLWWCRCPTRHRPASSRPG